MFDEAALTDDLLVQLVEVLKKHKASSDEETNFEPKTDKKDSSEGKEFWKLSNVQWFVDLLCMCREATYVQKCTKFGVKLKKQPKPTHQGIFEKNTLIGINVTKCPVIYA